MRRIQVLGDLEVRTDTGELVPVPARLHRRLLAALTVRAGRTCSRDHLVHALWGDTPPASAVKVLQTYICVLRRTLEGAPAIRTVGSAYRLEGDLDGAVDAAEFECLLARARAARAGADASGAEATLERALALWRGRAYEEFAEEPFAAPESARLERLRLEAEIEWLEGALRLGRAREAVVRAVSLAAEQPLNEHVQAVAMLALYRCHRPGEALLAYETTRQALSEELGLDPGVELAHLRLLIHRRDPSLNADLDG